MTVTLKEGGMEKDLQGCRVNRFRSVFGVCLRQEGNTNNSIDNIIGNIHFTRVAPCLHCTRYLQL